MTYEHIFLTEHSLHAECMKTFYDVISSILCCAKEALASIVLD